MTNADVLKRIQGIYPHITDFITLDFETYYASDYTLSKMTTESYVRDPRFQTIGVGIKTKDEKCWLEAWEFRDWASKVDWSRVAVEAHHAHFDGLISSYHYGIIPAFWVCTMSMARCFVPVEVGGSLAKLSRHFGVGEKGDEVVKAFGKRRQDFTPEEWIQYGIYCMNDCELTDGLGCKMIERIPDEELVLMDMTIRAFTEPVFKLNSELLKTCIKDEKTKKIDLLMRVAQAENIPVPQASTEDQVLQLVKPIFASNDKFAALLIDMGEIPPTKISVPKTKTAMEKAIANGVDPETVEPVETYAFAKTDIGMQELLENEREEIRFVAEARVGVKSTINETRAQRLYGMSLRGPATVYLRYHGAHTSRFSGGDKSNFQNFERGGTLRDCLIAPDDPLEMPESWQPYTRRAV